MKPVSPYGKAKLLSFNITKNYRQQFNLKSYNALKKIILKEKPSHFVHFGSKNPSFKQDKGFYKENFISTKNIIKAIIETNKNYKSIEKHARQQIL